MQNLNTNIHWIIIIFSLVPLLYLTYKNFFISIVFINLLCYSFCSTLFSFWKNFTSFLNMFLNFCSKLRVKICKIFTFNLQLLLLQNSNIKEFILKDLFDKCVY